MQGQLQFGNFVKPIVQQKALKILRSNQKIIRQPRLSKQFECYLNVNPRQAPGETACWHVFGPDFEPTQAQIEMEELDKLVQGSEWASQVVNQYSEHGQVVMQHNLMKPRKGYFKLSPTSVQHTLSQAQVVEPAFDEMTSEYNTKKYIGMHYAQNEKTNQFVSAARLGQIMAHLNTQDRIKQQNKDYNPLEDEPGHIFHRAMDILDTETDTIAKEYPLWAKGAGDYLGGPARSPHAGPYMEEPDDQNSIDNLLGDLPGAYQAEANEYSEEYDHMLDNDNKIIDQQYDNDDYTEEDSLDSNLKSDPSFAIDS